MFELLSQINSPENPFPSVVYKGAVGACAATLILLAMWIKSQSTKLTCTSVAGWIQRFVIPIALFLAVSAGVFPPWVETMDTDYASFQRSAGFAWIGSPPMAEYGEAGIVIDFPRLGLIWACIAGAAMGLFWTIKALDKSNKTKPSTQHDHVSTKPKPSIQMNEQTKQQQAYMLGGGKTRNPRLGIVIWILAGIIAVGVIKTTIWDSIAEASVITNNASE